MAKPCRICGGTNNTTTFCFKNKRSPFRSKKPRDRKTGLPLRRAGKRTIAWLKFRTEYLESHPPNHQGYYVCHYCGDWIIPSVTTLDHIIPRSKRPDLVLVESNIVISCYGCNQDKGSKVYPELFS